LGSAPRRHACLRDDFLEPNGSRVVHASIFSVLCSLFDNRTMRRFALLAVVIIAYLSDRGMVRLMRHLLRWQDSAELTADA